VTLRAGTRRLTALAVGGALLAGCAYYNGMYNTNRLVRSARKAERQGRPFEAAGLWGQVITRAESVTVRHPRSKYAAQATVLRGLAMSRLGQCATAIEPLGQASLLPRGDLAEEATLALGRCRIQTGDAASADLAFRELIDSKDAVVRSEARFQHARALRMTGHYDEAITLLQEAKTPRADDELLLALAGAGRDGEADSLTTRLIASGDTTRKWDSLVTILGSTNPASADKLIDRLTSRTGATPQVVGRRLYEDGIRLETIDSTRAIARFKEAARSGVGTESGERASLKLLQRDISHAPGVQAFGPVADSLKGLASKATVVNDQANNLLLAIIRVRLAADSGAASFAQGDLRLFLAAEMARDTLEAPHVAGELFRRIVSEWPASPYAPKALLAAQHIDSTWADSAQAILAERYTDSPYLAVLRGESTDGYRALEDSLLTFAATQHAAPRPGVGGRIRAGPGELRAPRRRVRESTPSDSAVGRRVLQ
jgi:tetratricopeptide (TPR) repeat protein